MTFALCFAWVEPIFLGISPIGTLHYAQNKKEKLNLEKYNKNKNNTLRVTKSINCVELILIIINVLSTKRKEKEKKTKAIYNLHDNYGSIFIYVALYTCHTLVSIQTLNMFCVPLFRSNFPTHFFSCWIN